MNFHFTISQNLLSVHNISTKKMPLVTVMRHSDRMDEDPSVIIPRIFDCPLSDKGVRRALNTKIPGVKKTFASPMLRSVHTAVLSTGTHSFVDGVSTFTPNRVTVDNRLCEVWNRDVLRAPIDTVTLLTTEGYDAAMGISTELILTDHPLPLTEESRGTGGTADERFLTAIQDISRENSDFDHILIVTHGDAVSSMASLVGLTVYETNYCCFITAEFNGTWKFVSSNGVGFLS